VLAAALTASSLPMIGEAHARNQAGRLDAIFSRSYSIGLGLTAPLVGVLVLTAPIWIPRLCPGYPGIGPSFAIAGVAVIIFFASSQTTALLNATHRDRAASRSAVLGLVAASAALVWLVPYGAVGVAWARVTGEVARLAFEGAAATRDVGVRASSLVRPWISVSPVLAGMALAVLFDWQSPIIWIAAAAVLLGSAGLRHVWKRSAPEDLSEADSEPPRIG
jgi:O-antigen/teichoic acid export membrane protein